MMVLIAVERRDHRSAAGFLGLFWGMYALFCLMTNGMEVAVGGFGS